MLGHDATWGDVREIYKRSLEMPDMKLEDNILADPEVRAYSEDKPDNEYIQYPGKMLGDNISEPEDDEDGYGDRVEFGIVFDQDKALLLVRTDWETGEQFYRSKDEWVMVEPDDEIPVLDNFPLTRVTGDAVRIWDNSDGERTKDDYLDVLLDGASE